MTDVKYLLGILAAANLGSKPAIIMNSNRLLGLSLISNAAGDFLFRDEVSAGRLLNVPILSSTTVPTGDIVIIDAASFAAANDTPNFAISDQTVLTMANADGTIPTQAAADATNAAVGTAEQVPADAGIFVNSGDAAGPDAVGVGAKAMSMYQQFSTALRMVLPTSWGLTRAGSVGRITGAGW